MTGPENKPRTKNPEAPLKTSKAATHNKQIGSPTKSITFHTKHQPGPVTGPKQKLAAKTRRQLQTTSRLEPCDRRGGHGPSGDGVGARPPAGSGPDRRRGRGPTGDAVGARPPAGSGPDRRRGRGPTADGVGDGPQARNNINLHKRKAATHKQIRSSTLTKSSSPTKQPSDSPVTNQAAQKRHQPHNKPEARRRHPTCKKNKRPEEHGSRRLRNMIETCLVF